MIERCRTCESGSGEISYEVSLRAPTIISVALYGSEVNTYSEQ